jgi:hypothetical protein
MKTKKQNNQFRISCKASLMTLAVIALFSCSQSAQAQWTVPDGNGNISNTNSGNVGIGTQTPGDKLDVNGGVRVQNGGLFRVLGTGGSQGWFRGHPSMAGIELGSYSNHALWFITNGTERMRIASTGNIGIGTATPNARLHVAGGALMVSDRGDNCCTLFQMVDGPMETHFYSYGSGYGSGSFQIHKYGPGSLGGAAFTILNGGNVGIGTTTPGYKLDVNGTINASQWSPGSNSALSYSTGNVGIGTTTPNARLHVAGGGLMLGDRGDNCCTDFRLVDGPMETHFYSFGSGYGSGGFQIHKYGPGSIGGAAFTILNGGNVGVGTTTPGYKLDVNGTINATGILVNGSPISGGGSQWTSGTNSISYSAGNVGIGTSGTSYKLDVNGSTNVTGNLNVAGTGNINAVGTITGGKIVATYQDMAEWVPSSEEIPAGTVVVLDVTKSNQVVRSTQSYDTRVAGVVSAQPGIALGESGANKVLVATTGRVMVKVDASRAPIHIGDLLVTSDVSGVAMKSEPINLGGRKMHMPGTLIGKALEPLEKGSGKILVLLSLQ